MKLASLLPRPSLVICAKCGGINIMIMDWIDPNRDIVFGGADDPQELDTHCDDCDDTSDNGHTGIIAIPTSGLTEVEVELAITKAIM